MTSHAPSWPTDDDPEPHPGIELLADLAEGLADPADLPALRRHLSGCEDCADTYAALTEVQQLLGATTTPPMPADVAARIDAALAAAAAPAAAEAAPAEAVPPAVPPAVPAPPNRKADATGPSTHTGPGRARRRRRVLLSATALFAALGLGVLVIPQNSPFQRADSASAPAAPGSGPQQHPAVASGLPVYTDDRLPEQIQRLLARPATPTTGTPKTESSTGRLQANATPRPPSEPTDVALRSCLPAATGHGAEPPLAVGPGRYGPAEVTALVYPIADRPDQLDVYLVTPVCPGATVLLHRTVPTG